VQNFAPAALLGNIWSSYLFDTLFSSLNHEALSLYIRRHLVIFEQPQS
jgi:hypothetical protein